MPVRPRPPPVSASAEVSAVTRSADDEDDPIGVPGETDGGRGTGGVLARVAEALLHGPAEGDRGRGRERAGRPGLNHLDRGADGPVQLRQFRDGRPEISGRLVQCLDRPSGLVQPGRRQTARAPHPIPRIVDAAGFEFGFHRVQLDDESAESMREHVMQVAGEPRSLGQGRRACPLLEEFPIPERRGARLASGETEKTCQAAPLRGR